MVSEGVAMHCSSGHPNVLSSVYVRMACGEQNRPLSYSDRMTRKRPTASQGPQPDWFLVEWMRSKRVSQAELGRRTGWSKATVNDIYHGKTSYYREILNIAAKALEIEPYELLMSPEYANALKQQRAASFTIVEAAPDPTDLEVKKNGTWQ